MSSWVVMPGQRYQTEPDFPVTLRDYLAAAALQGLLGNAERKPFPVEPAESFVEATAGMAYAYADAMLKAREQ